MEELRSKVDIVGRWLAPVLNQWVFRLGFGECFLLIVWEVEVIDR